jgi:hypothetical protein
MAIKERNDKGEITKAEGGGRIKGARNLQQAEILSNTLRHWRDGGSAAINVVFAEKPETYLKIVASILPKELLIEDARKIKGMTDDELAGYLAEIRRLRSLQVGEAGGDTGGRTNETLTHLGVRPHLPGGGGEHHL